MHEKAKDFISKNQIELHVACAQATNQLLKQRTEIGAKKSMAPLDANQISIELKFSFASSANHRPVRTVLKKDVPTMRIAPGMQIQNHMGKTCTNAAVPMNSSARKIRISESKTLLSEFAEGLTLELTGWLEASPVERWVGRHTGADAGDFELCLPKRDTATGMGEADARTQPTDRLCRRQGQRIERYPNTPTMNDTSSLAANGRTARR